ncbi:hypothetical protein CO058_01285, partial [candidate division WWE3 bacterium CG_4_9_14_0_2_um_filter_35_11]
GLGINAGGTRLFVKNNGNVGIGTTGPSVALDVVGDIEYTGTITDVSDIRLKENFEPIVNPLGIINGLQGLKFNMIGSNIREVGLIAQDVQNVLPEAVRVVDPENGYLGVSYPSLIPVLIEGIKEQQGQISLLSGQMSSFASVLSVSAGGTGGDGLNGQGNVGAVRIDGHCVTGDTMLPIRRRKRRKDGDESEDIDDYDYLYCRINEVQAGDEVLSLDEGDGDSGQDAISGGTMPEGNNNVGTGTLGYARINALMDMDVHEVYEITTKSGRKIRTTANHPYLTLVCPASEVAQPLESRDQSGMGQGSAYSFSGIL